MDNHLIAIPADSDHWTQPTRDLRQLEAAIIGLSASRSVDQTLAMVSNALAVIAAEPGHALDHFEILVSAFSESAGPRSCHFSGKAQADSAAGPIVPDTLYDWDTVPIGGGQ